MALSKPVVPIKDSITFTLNEADLTGKKVGEELRTMARDVPSMNGVQWWIDYYPAGEDEDCKNHLSVFLVTSAAVSATFRFKIDHSCIHQSFTQTFGQEKTNYGPPKFASHEELHPLFVNGKLWITCEVEFYVSVPFACLAPRLAQHCGHVPVDFEIVVGSNRLQVHKSLLSLMSPVFHAMLAPNSAGVPFKVDIKGFDFETVKATIDFCYGREMETPSVETVVAMLRFAYHYGIKCVTVQLERMARLGLSTETFYTIVRYAYQCSNDALFDDCCDFFENNQSDVVATEKFKTLSLPLVTRLLKWTFGLKTQFDILRHAHANRIDFILDPLEQPIIEALSLDTFCDTVKYAWDCSRDDLKVSCAKFFNDNQAEIRKMKNFINLPPATTHGVLKLGYELL
uniref:BTB domain-containing protein n=1 Tax=Panagrellus redivivus TaxID=6233 RepID=A0A7E4VUP6_PANRE